MRGVWQTKKLGELCRTGAGGTPLKSHKEYYDGGSIPWLLSGEVSQRDIRSATSFITEEGLRNSSAKLFPAKTVLVAMYGATAGQVGILKFEAATNQAVCGIFPSEAYLPEFLYYFLLWQKDALVARAVGNAQPNISQEKIRDIDVPVVSGGEQQRIVAILDEAFEGIATAKANAEKNLKSAKSSFDSYLQSVFAERGEGWVDATLGDAVDLLVGFAFKSAKYSDGEGDISLLRGDNIVQGSLRWDDVKKWPKNDTAAYERYRLREGDVVLAMDRPWVKAGLKHATITADDLPCLLVQRTACLRCKPRLDSRFLLYLVRSAAFIRHILGVQTGIGVPHISGQQIKDFAYACPPVADQERIAARLDALSVEIQKLESIYQKKIAALDDLKKSLLHHAFSGEL